MIITIIIVTNIMAAVHLQQPQQRMIAQQQPQQHQAIIIMAAVQQPQQHQAIIIMAAVQQPQQLLAIAQHHLQQPVEQQLQPQQLLAIAQHHLQQPVEQQLQPQQLVDNVCRQDYGFVKNSAYNHIFTKESTTTI